MKHFFGIFLLFLAVLTVSCKKNTSTTVASSVARVTSFYFAKNDSFPGLAEASFTVKELLDTGLVYNKDSMLYGTSLRRVVPKFTFEATPSSATLALGDTSFALTGTDTCDFTRQPIYLTVVSQDGSTTKVYRIAPTVHRVDPDLWTWTRLSDDILTGDFEQQVLPLGGEFVLLSNNGFRSSVYTSPDGASWTKKAEPSLPASCHVRNIISDGSRLYYIEEQTLFTSTDGSVWTPTDYSAASYTIYSMLMYFNGTVWAVVEKEDLDLYLATVDNTTITPTSIRLDDRFPIDNFATAVFTSTSNRARALVLGGYSREGASLNSRWSFEAYHNDDKDTLRVKNYTIEQPHFTSLTGASLAWYGNRLYLFGGINGDAHLQAQTCLVSDDEGMNWFAPDSTKIVIPAAYGVRQKQSLVLRDNSIYLFGGQNGVKVYSDTYSARINSIDWKD